LESLGQARRLQQRVRPSSARPVIATETETFTGVRAGPLAAAAVGMGLADCEAERTLMGPAIALRLRQHLTLTPQVQQALRLLQMSALEFGQEMDQALASNPFLEETGDAQATPRESSPSTIEEVVVPQEAPAGAGGGAERDHEEWSGATEMQPTLREHLREQ